MASDLFKMHTSGASATVRGQRLRALMEQLDAVWRDIESEFDALTQEKDGSAGDETDYITPTAVFGFDDGGGTVGTTAEAAYAELNSILNGSGAHAAAIKQACARFKQ